MTIPEFKQRTKRQRIGVLGTLPPEGIRALERRGFRCLAVSLGAMPDDTTLRGMDCLIVVQRPRDRMTAELVVCLRALAFDCRVYVQRAVDQTSVALLDLSIRVLTNPVIDANTGERISEAVFDPACFAHRDDLLFGPCVHLFSAETDEAWERFANLVMENPAGLAPATTLSVVGEGLERLSPEQHLLLARAFSDCREIRLIGKVNGLSGVATFEIHADPGSPDVNGTWPAQWPARFFAKLGCRSTVEREYRQYLQRAMEQVPFHLGPRLRVDRCCLGPVEGLIVSDYVSGAEALRDCAREGRGTTAIANLFNVTLWAWRRGAKDEPRMLGSVLLPKLNRERPDHREALYTALGATRSVADLRTDFERCTSSPVLIGVIHGDLHATNVLVRQNDAVIIDLEKVEDCSPLLFDAASLEGGLLIDGFIKGDDRPVAEILESILQLYEPGAFKQDDHFCLPHSRSHWFFESVRQIRMQATQLERGRPGSFQYAWTLAAVLIRKSCNPDDFTKLAGETPQSGRRREEIRAMAYVVAETILRGLLAAPAQAEGASQ